MVFHYYIYLLGTQHYILYMHCIALQWYSNIIFIYQVHSIITFLSSFVKHTTVIMLCISSIFNLVHFLSIFRPFPIKMLNYIMLILYLIFIFFCKIGRGSRFTSDRLYLPAMGNEGRNFLDVVVLYYKKKGALCQFQSCFV